MVHICCTQCPERIVTSYLSANFEHFIDAYSIECKHLFLFAIYQREQRNLKALVHVFTLRSGFIHDVTRVSVAQR